MVKSRASPKGRVEPNPAALFDDSGEGKAAPAIADDDDDDDGPEPSDQSVADGTKAMPTKLPFEAKLVVEKGAYAGKVLKLGAGTAVIGRSSKCELSLKGSSGVSRRHCKVQLVNDRYVILDLESRNGTVVNGETVSRKFLTDGDLLEIGDEHVRFVAVNKGKILKSPPVSDPDISQLATMALQPQQVQQAKAMKAAGADAHLRIADDVAGPPATTPDKDKQPAKSSSAGRTQPKSDKPPPRPPLKEASRRRDAPPPPARDDDDRPIEERSTGKPLDANGGAPRVDATASFMFEPGMLEPHDPRSSSRARVDRTFENEPSEPEPIGAPTFERSESRAPPPPRGRADRGMPPDSSIFDDRPPLPAKKSGGGALKFLLFLALLIVGGLGVAGYDIALGDQNILAVMRGDPPPIFANRTVRETLAKVGIEVKGPDIPPPIEEWKAGADGSKVIVDEKKPDEAAAAADAGVASAGGDEKKPDEASASATASATASGVADAGTAAADASKQPDEASASAGGGEKKPDEASASGGSSDANKKPDEASANAGAGAGGDEKKPDEDKASGSEAGGGGGGAEGVVVKAASGGRIGSVKVKVGSVVKKGQTLATFEVPRALYKKLESLREEERELDEAAKKGNKSAKRDLESVRRDLAEIQRKTRPTPLTSDVSGTVVEVLVKPDENVKAGAAIAKIAPE